jgi:hypothetical protein
MITPEMAALIAKTQARALAGQPNAGGASPAVNPKSAAAAAAAAVAARLSSSFPSAAPRQMTTLPAPQQFAAAPSAVPRQMTTLPAPPQLVAAPQMLAAPHVVAAAVTGQISSAPTSSFKRRPDNWPPVGFARFGVLINGQQATPGMARHDMLVTVPVVSRLIGSQGSAYKEMTTSTGCNIHIIDKEAPPGENTISPPPPTPPPPPPPPPHPTATTHGHFPAPIHPMPRPHPGVLLCAAECPPWNTTGIMGGPHSSLRLVCLIGSP